MMSQPTFHPLPLNPTAQEYRPTHFPLIFLIPVAPSPTRALLLTSVPPTVSESTIRRELELFGHVRAVQMDRLRHGIVTVHFYDLRQATEALNKIQQQHFDRLTVSGPLEPAPGLISGRVVWAQFVFPGLTDRYNQGTVVVTSDSNVSTALIRDVFQAFGEVKEIRWSSSPLKPNERLVEFYDIRDATKAVHAKQININGKPVTVELFNGHKPQYYFKHIISNQVHHVVPEVNSSNKNNIVYRRRHSPDKLCQGGRSKLWKSTRDKSCDDPSFLIKADDVFQDSRTTVMIKNIPNKYSQKLLLNMLDNHCIKCNENEGDNQPLSSYDFVYLPIDFVNKCNVGYGFVNMTSPEATWRLYKAFNHQNWEVFNSKKICQVSYARLQGIEALKEHFKNSKFPPCSAEQSTCMMPIVFTPPRDGRTLTHPTPIINCRPTSSSSSDHTSSAAAAADNNTTE
ncbi:hypothetical protein QVD17_21266 [Tagetes erecta]|uniref:RRM domain-containing protein n=1 Tax=Tagetes erecta TaxID=13708 RepID=A0AAD8KN90_TARER|nr:hypothetical protein QVD17_21266 [Tagetes erecta]